MYKVLVVGKNSFIGKNLYKLLNKKLLLSRCTYSEFKNKNEKFLKKYNYIINCTSNDNYINKKYNVRFDHDFYIARKISKLNVKFIFISSRKIYRSSDNIKENDKISPKSNYSKNKFTTEKKIIKLLNKNVLILRVSNLIGVNKTLSKRKLHNTFIDIFIANVKKGYIFESKKIYKDFLSVEKFCQIVFKLIQNRARGIYNISMGKRVYIHKLLEWLNFYNTKKLKVIKLKKEHNLDCFYLNNKRLLKKTGIKISLIDLERYCKKISKTLFIKR